MIQLEMGEPSMRRQMFDIDLNKESLTTGLDLIKEYSDKIKIMEEEWKIWAMIPPTTRSWRNRSVAHSVPSTRLRFLQNHPQNLLLDLQT